MYMQVNKRVNDGGGGYNACVQSCRLLSRSRMREIIQECGWWVVVVMVQGVF
jgi:hypothetical protein